MTHFTTLPTEVRLEIYRSLLIPQANLLSNRNLSYIEISDISPERYIIGIASGSIRHRTGYHPKPVQVLRCACRIRNMYRCAELRPQLRTSYTHTGHDLHTGILSVNRAISQESREVFYSKNAFHFKSTSAVLPFLQDRQRSWPYIKRLSFFLPLDHHGHASWKHQEYVRIFDTIAASPTLKLTTLNLTISDTKSLGLEPNGRAQGVSHWLENVRSIRDLDCLSIKVLFLATARELDWFRPYYSMWYGTPADGIDIKIWCYLAPKVLRQDRVLAASQANSTFRALAPLIFDPRNPHVYHWD